MGQTIALDASTVLACSELGEQGANDVLMSASNVLEAVGVSMYHESKIVSSLVYKRATCQCAVCTVVWDAFTHIVVAMAKWSKYRLAEEFDTAPSATWAPCARCSTMGSDAVSTTPKTSGLQIP